ncbi:PdaC/SigV domain-containing protein [Erythrobacter sp. SD-21]|uniref:PdaC/SigV domain-containing protein n=1 Tax=Erythrobacter sp. SD-21 TaxID=161528 RepID=UPI000153FD4C|nr:DUF4163 domain-containing protein [Erythrobacter sp. SD-21]EDL48690.1 hypothetical protein ED21_30834 [Erythrobacter sp. SD-21]
MRTPLFLISLALSSAACAPGGDETGQPIAGPENPRAPASPKAPDALNADAVQAFTFDDQEQRDGGTREFSYSWPREVARIEPLAVQLDKERTSALTTQRREWEQSLVDFPGDCVSCKSRGYEKEWQVVADLPGYLSLSANLYEYTGGAHGIYGKQSLVWDKERARSLAGIELFNSPVALENALGARLCEALDRARERKRGMAVDRSSGGAFNDCPGLDEASLLIGSSNGQTFDRIGVYFGPYVAGAYAEGDYELNFPVTGSVLDAVKPEYASAFSVKR